MENINQKLEKAIIPSLLNGIHDTLLQITEQQNVTFKKSLILGDYRSEAKEVCEQKLVKDPETIVDKLQIISEQLYELAGNIRQTNESLKHTIG